ncbi:hypothetical protein BS50DRAFT_566831 [Corynespora cassiicola Philippines]|uniref:Uncharacterized protein n=1 Tax=Corynespora cassiicola Philippines TaxID=1448308 RepID=A0A2T2P8D3_CORCC|nr:hypothetical protein BS50DRAFT_566831 [Corynespora cassiicola Philippines]
MSCQVGNAQDGHTAEFLSEKELLEYIKITELLAKTNAMRNIPEFFYQRYNRCNHREALYHYLTDFSNLLVRRDESIAVAAVDTKGHLLRISETVACAGSAPKDDAEVDETNVGLASDGAADIGDSVARWWLSRAKSNSGKGLVPSTNVTTAEHGATLVQLVRRTYTAKDDAEQRVSREKLSQYVYVSSCARIYSRFEAGRGSRNLYEFLTKTGDDIRAFTGAHAQDQASNLLEDEPLSAPHTRALSLLIDTLRSLHDVDLQDATAWEEALADGQPIYYNASGRLAFQTLISLVVTELYKAVVDLVCDLNDGQTIKEDDCPFPYPSPYTDHGPEWDPLDPQAWDWAQATDERASTVGTLMALLGLLRVDLGRYLVRNLVFLRGVFEIADARTRVDGRFYQPQPQPQSQQQPSQEGLDESLRAEVAEVDNEVQRKAWGCGVLLWLEQIGLHDRAMMKLSKSLAAKDDRNRVCGDVVRSVKLEYVRVDSPPAQACPPPQHMGDYLDGFEIAPGSKLAGGDVVRIRRWMYRMNGNLPVDYFLRPVALTPALHCEATIPSLYIFARHVQKAQKAGARTAWPHSLPSQRTIDSLASPLHVLAASQKCCPSCSALSEWTKTRELDVPVLLYPGGVALWRASALAPWLPRRAGEAMLHHARTCLRFRLGQILEAEKTIEMQASFLMNPLRWNF